MSPQEIAEYMGLAGTAVAGAYATYMVLGAIAQDFLTEKVSEEDLEKVVNEEAANLGMDSRNIIAVYDKRIPARCTIRGYDQKSEEFVSSEEIDGEDVFEVKILELGKFGASRGMVKHELYHLNGHFPRPKGFLGKLKYAFYHEPAAILYAITGLKV